ncbi:hypothetical protein J2TS4_40520 [Paenibacillus sp. J2TS4]|nr:hypothetical protein J2TS4_40520 [Paenibacillus sp. J2TS4]
MFIDYWAKEKLAEERQRETERGARYLWKEITEPVSTPSFLLGPRYQALQQKAVEVLEDMLNNDNPDTRLRAAEIILRNAPAKAGG